MALQAQAQLLDELMGKFRNVAPGEKTGSVRFDNDDVCKYYLCGYCPHDLFVNTRADLGPCTKIHDDEMKRLYEKSSRFGKLGYEDDFERFLRSLLLDVEKKIKRGRERLKLTQVESLDDSNPLKAKQERVTELREIINEYLKKAEALGEEGRVEEAQQTLEEAEPYQTECKYLQGQLDAVLNNNDQKQMEVCEVCGSFLIVNDAQARVEEHINGKQHMGYAKVKSTLEEIRVKRQKEYEEREKLREKERERRREPEKEKRREENGGRRDRSKERRRSRSRDRNNKTAKHRSRSRSRDRRDRKRGSRDDSRNRRHRSRSKDRNGTSDHKRSKRSSSKTKSNTNVQNELSNREDGEIEQGEVKSDDGRSLE